MSEYPECDKLNALSESFHVLHEFLDYLSQDGLRLCRLEDTGQIRWDGPVEQFFPTYEAPQDLICRFLGLDTKRLELERRAMLDELRKQS